MHPINVGATGPVKKPGCLGPSLGAAGLLLAAIFGPIGIMAITSDPILGIVGLVVASFGGVLFGRAWVADHRRRETQRRTIRRWPAADGDPRVRYADRARPTGDAIALGLRSFLDDPDRLGYVDIEGPRSFRVHFALLATDANVLRGEAIALSRLVPQDHPGPDAGLGLANMGWAAPTWPSREDFAAEWSLPVDLARLSLFVRSTAAVYKVDATLLRPRFGSPDSVGDRPAADGLQPPGEGAPVAAPAMRRFSAVVRRLSRHPAVTWSSFAIALLALIAGPDRLEAFIRLIPPGLILGAFGIVLFSTGVRFLARYLRTSDPFSLTGWNSWRGRTVTTYKPHVWWGITGAIGVIAGIGLLMAALGTFA